MQGDDEQDAPVHHEPATAGEAEAGEARSINGDTVRSGGVQAERERAGLEGALWAAGTSRTRARREVNHCDESRGRAEVTEEIKFPMRGMVQASLEELELGVHLEGISDLLKDMAQRFVSSTKTACPM